MLSKISLGLFCLLISSTVLAEFSTFGNSNAPRVGSLDWQQQTLREGEQKNFQQQQMYQQQQQLDLQRQQLEESQRQRQMLEGNPMYR